MYKLSSGLWKSDFKLYGKRMQKNLGTRNKAEAIRLEREWKKELMENLWQDKGGLLDDMLNPSIVIPNNSMKLSEASDWMYERVWQYAQDSKNPPSRLKTLIRVIGDVDICSITDADLLKIKKKFLKDGIDGKIYTGKTFNHIMVSLRTTMNMLEETKTLKLPNKPTFKGVSAPDVGTRIVCFSDDELRQMYDFFETKANQKRYIKNVEMLEFFIINSNLGLRPSEFYALEVGDIDFKNKSITISKAIKQYAVKKTIGVTKNGVIRTLPIDGIVLETLKKMVERVRIAKETPMVDAPALYLKEPEGELKELYYWIQQGHYEWARGTALERCSLTRLRPKWVENAWKEMQIALGLNKKPNPKDYTMYALRHTVASRLVSIKKFSAHKLMTYLGHTNISTSLKYVHLNVDDIRDGCGVGINSDF